MSNRRPERSQPKSSRGPESVGQLKSNRRPKSVGPELMSNRRPKSVGQLKSNQLKAEERREPMY